jgi:hypothetical protein
MAQDPTAGFAVTLPQGDTGMSPNLTGDELYNLLMLDIEPELTTALLPTLDEKYKDEAPEESKARAERYEKAFAEYDKKFEEYVSTAKQRIHERKREALTMAEGDDREKETGDLQNLEQSMQNI